MPRPINPVGPRRKDERAYDKAIRDVLLSPIMRQLRRGLSQAAAAAITLDVIDDVFRGSWRVGGLVEDEVVAHARRLQGYHRRRLIQTFKAALGVDIRPVLSDIAIEPLMAAWRRENIRLIRTIPERFHESLRRRVTETFADRPFDQSALSKVLNREYRSTGYNLRRLTRDQTSKAIGQLTHARQTQLGITEYLWRTAQDERVRETHATLDGTTHRWDTPPGVGHPGQDIQCRCVAIPVLAASTGRTSGTSTPGREPDPPSVAEFTPQKLPETGLGQSYTVETEQLVTALGGVDPRTSLGTQRVRNYVRTRGSNDGFEHMALVDLDSGAVHAGTVHQVDGVDFFGSIAATLSDPARRVVVYHNHPRSTALSRPDIRVLGDHRGIEQIEAVAHNGSLSVARLPEQLKGSVADGSTQFWESTLREANGAVKAEYQQRINSGQLSIATADKTHSDTVNRVLAESGALDYTSTHNPQIQDVGFLISQTLKNLVDGVK